MPFEFTMDYFHEAKHLNLYHAKENDIKHIQWPCDMQELSIIGEYLDHFDIPNGVEVFTGCHLGLKSVTIPDSMKRIYLDDNFLYDLELPVNIEYVSASENYITHVRFKDGKQPMNLIELDLRANRLLELNFEPPTSLEILDLRINRYLDYKRVNPALMRIADVTPRSEDLFA